MVSMRNDMITRQQDAVEDASTGELITRLTRETVALAKAEVARLRLQASSIVAPAAVIGAMTIVAMGTFLLGLTALGVALFAGILAVTKSFVISGLVVGAVAWIIAAVAGAICAGVARAIPLKIRSLR
jgi:hypothetical protein